MFVCPTNLGAAHKDPTLLLRSTTTNTEHHKNLTTDDNDNNWYTHNGVPGPEMIKARNCPVDPCFWNFLFNLCPTKWVLWDVPVCALHVGLKIHMVWCCCCPCSSTVLLFIGFLILFPYSYWSFILFPADLVLSHSETSWSQMACVSVILSCVYNLSWLIPVTLWETSQTRTTYS